MFLNVKENSTGKFVGPMGGVSDRPSLIYTIWQHKAHSQQGQKSNTVYKWKMLEVKVEVPKLVWKGEMPEDSDKWYS